MHFGRRLKSLECESQIKSDGVKFFAFSVLTSIRSEQPVYLSRNCARQDTEKLVGYELEPFNRLEFLESRQALLNLLTCEDSVDGLYVAVRVGEDPCHALQVPAAH